LAFEIDTAASPLTHPAGLGLCPGAPQPDPRQRAANHPPVEGGPAASPVSPPAAGLVMVPSVETLMGGLPTGS